MKNVIFKKVSTILIWSEHYRKLAKWYEETFNLVNVEELKHPKDTGILYGFAEGDTRIWIGEHSEVKGMNKDNLRIMFNINVDSVKEAFKYLKGKGAKVIAKPFKAPTFDKYFATFSDPDGNVFQIIGAE
jgi:predicted enzyme related to lactoylglutathione lyase